MSKTTVLLVFNSKEAETALSNLLSMDEFGAAEWSFRTCTETKTLLHEQKADVVVISRSLPGVEKHLKEIKNRFMGSRMIFHVGRLNESAKVFISKAQKLGYKNFIAGAELRGDRPYTLPIAIRHDYEDVMGHVPQAEPAGPAGQAVQVDLIRVLVFGPVPLGQDVEAAVAKKAGEAKKALSKDRFDAVVVQSGYKGSEEFIRSVRRVYAGPILVFGDYAPELISLGATGCVSDPVDIAKYVEMGRVLERRTVG